MNWKETFRFNGRSLYYNKIGINNCSERAVEVPIGFNFLANLVKKEKILEVGNVLSNYENSLSEYLALRPRHIVDKFEFGTNVDNVDLMELPSDKKYDAIVSISTVEHIGQGVAPAEAYGEQTTIRDLEAPLKAIARIYELLIVGGKALITVPFGKLTDGLWYIQFGLEYLELLETKYNIPTKAISKVFMRRLALEITEISTNNPSQIWAEEKEVHKLSGVQYNFPWPYANALAILELTKFEDFSSQINNSNFTSLNYEESIPNPTVYQELLEDSFLNIIDKLKDLNIIFCSTLLADNEELILSQLEKIICGFLTHPDRNRITLLIYISDISEEEANIILSAASLNSLMKSNLDVTDEAEICLLGQLSNVQWSALLPCINYRVLLEKNDRQVSIPFEMMLDAEKIPSGSIDSFRNKRTVQSETGSWFLK